MNISSLSVIGTIVLTILPALFAGMLASQAYKIRVILNNKLLIERGKYGVSLLEEDMDELHER